MDPFPPRSTATLRRRRLPVPCLGVALVVALASSPAIAQTQQDLATRRLLIEQATAARAAGRHADALALAQRAAAVQMTPSVRLFIAQEMAETGDPAGALGMADQCLRDVERDQAVANRGAILGECRSLVTESRSRVGYLVLRAPDPAPEGLRVIVRGVPVNPALLGAPYVVSPGDVVVEATATGRLAFRRNATVARGATVELPITLDPAPVVPVVVVAPTPLRAEPRPLTPPNRVGPVALISAGGAALIGGALLLVARGGALDGCTVTGGDAACADQASADSAASANGLAAGSGVLFGVGAAAIGAGLIWLLRAETPARQVEVSFGLVPARDGVAFGFTGRIP